VVYNLILNLITAVYQICFVSLVASDHSRHGIVQIPSFVQEPPAYVTFSNNTGAQITCVTHGNPVPLITWLTKDGSVVNSVPGLRLVASFFICQRIFYMFLWVKGFFCLLFPLSAFFMSTFKTFKSKKRRKSQIKNGKDFRFDAA
jgi:hypothetical protein